jgi:hypothetical protein
MEDRSLGIWLMVIFGVSGLAVLVLAWSLAAFESDRLAATLVGAVGIGVAVVRFLMLRRCPVGNGEGAPVSVQVENEE